MSKPSKPKIIGFTAEQAKAAKKFRETIAKNTPREILDAFFPDKVEVAGLRLQPVDLATFMLLEKIENPLAVLAGDGGQVKVGFRHLAEALLLLSLPLEAADELASDRAKFHEAVLQLGRRVSGAELLEVGKKISAQIQQAFATAIPTAAPGEKKASSGDPLAG